jgi:hypothetical protein
MQSIVSLKWLASPLSSSHCRGLGHLKRVKNNFVQLNDYFSDIFGLQTGAEGRWGRGDVWGLGELRANDGLRIGAFRGILFPGGQDFFDPINCRERNKKDNPTVHY